MPIRIGFRDNSPHNEGQPGRLKKEVPKEAGATYPPAGSYDPNPNRDLGTEKFKGYFPVWVLDELDGQWKEGYVQSASMRGEFVLVKLKGSQRIIQVNYRLPRIFPYKKIPG